VGGVVRRAPTWSDDSALWERRPAATGPARHRGVRGHRGTASRRDAAPTGSLRDLHGRLMLESNRFSDHDNDALWRGIWWTGLALVHPAGMMIEVRDPGGQRTTQFRGQGHLRIGQAMHGACRGAGAPLGVAKAVIQGE